MGVGVAAPSINSQEQNKKMSLLFTYIVDSLYFQIICGIVY